MYCLYSTVPPLTKVNSYKVFRLEISAESDAIGLVAVVNTYASKDPYAFTAHARVVSTVVHVGRTRRMSKIVCPIESNPALLSEHLEFWLISHTQIVNCV